MFSRFFRNPETGKVVIAQPPNLPLWMYLVATALRVVLRPDGSARAALALVAGVGLAWWSADEILRGDSPFRRVLGGVVGAGLLWRLVAD